MQTACYIRVVSHEEWERALYAIEILNLFTPFPCFTQIPLTGLTSDGEQLLLLSFTIITNSKRATMSTEQQSRPVIRKTYGRRKPLVAEDSASSLTDLSQLGSYGDENDDSPQENGKASHTSDEDGDEEGREATDGKEVATSDSGCFLNRQAASSPAAPPRALLPKKDLKAMLQDIDDAFDNDDTVSPPPIELRPRDPSPKARMYPTPPTSSSLSSLPSSKEASSTPPTVLDDAPTTTRSQSPASSQQDGEDSESERILATKKRASKNKRQVLDSDDEEANDVGERTTLANPTPASLAMQFSDDEEELPNERDISKLLPRKIVATSEDEDEQSATKPPSQQSEEIETYADESASEENEKKGKKSSKKGSKEAKAKASLSSSVQSSVKACLTFVLRIQKLSKAEQEEMHQTTEAVLRGQSGFIPPRSKTVRPLSEFWKKIQHRYRSSAYRVHRFSLG